MSSRSFHSCIENLQQLFDAQRLEFRREQSRLHEEFVWKGKMLRDNHIRNVHQMGDMKRARTTSRRFFCTILRERHQTMPRSTSPLQKMQKQMNSMVISVNFKEWNRYTVEDCFTFPVNQQWFQVFVRCWIATNVCLLTHGVRLDHKKMIFWQTILCIWFVPKLSSRNSLRCDTRRDKICSTTDWHKDLCSKRWRANQGHNSNADVCKKKSTTSFIILGGHSAEFYGSPAKTAAIRQTLRPTIIFMLENQIQKASIDYLFWFSVGCLVMDQKKGRSSIHWRDQHPHDRLLERNFQVSNSWTRRLLLLWIRSDKIHISRKMPVAKNRKFRKRIWFTMKTDRFHDLRLLSFC